MRLVRVLGIQALAALTLLALFFCCGDFASSVAQTASAPWRFAQAAANDKGQPEKRGVPATVVDGQQLESVLGIKAVAATGEDMGRIVDIIVDRGGRVRAAIIDFGGFLGVGSRQIAVDWGTLQFDRKGKSDVVVLNLTKDQLR